MSPLYEVHTVKESLETIVNKLSERRLKGESRLSIGDETPTFSSVGEVWVDIGGSSPVFKVSMSSTSDPEEGTILSASSTTLMLSDGEVTDIYTGRNISIFPSEQVREILSYNTTTKKVTVSALNPVPNIGNRYVVEGIVSWEDFISAVDIHGNEIHTVNFVTISEVNTAIGVHTAISNPHGTSFLNLSDTPANYSGSGNKFVRVNAGGSGIIFSDLPPISVNFLNLTDTPSSYSGQSHRLVRVNSGGTGLEFTTADNLLVNFLNLTDTPSTYSGHGNKVVRVNSAGSGLEFTTAGSLSLNFVHLNDTPSSYSTHNNKFVKVNSAGSGLEFVSSSNSGMNFVDLGDTPGSYSTHNSKFVRVNSAGSGLEFVEGSVADHGNEAHVTDFGLLTANNTWQRAQSGPIVTLTDAATISFNAALGNNYRVVLGGNRTLANPTNLVDGWTFNLIVRQDGTGNRTLSFQNKYLFSEGEADLTSDANAFDLITGMYSSIDDKIFCTVSSDFKGQM